MFCEKCIYLRAESLTSSDRPRSSWRQRGSGGKRASSTRPRGRRSVRGPTTTSECPAFVCLVNQSTNQYSYRLYNNNSCCVPLMTSVCGVCGVLPFVLLSPCTPRVYGVSLHYTAAVDTLALGNCVIVSCLSPCTCGHLPQILLIKHRGVRSGKLCVDRCCVAPSIVVGL